MEPPFRLKLTARPEAKERRLAELLGGREGNEPALRAAVEDAQVLGSLGLSGIAVTPEDVGAARRGQVAPAAAQRLLAALGAVAPSAPLDLRALRAWNAAVTGGSGELRRAHRERYGGPPPSPPEFIASRLELLAAWVSAESGRELAPAQQGALVLARVLEIQPFDEGNGRVARLAASHVMVRAGSRAPLLNAGDAARLDEAVQAAYRLETRPLVELLGEAAERALDVLIAALSRQPAGPGATDPGS